VVYSDRQRILAVTGKNIDELTVALHQRVTDLPFDMNIVSIAMVPVSPMGLIAVVQMVDPSAP
jgi:hypothetical protein